MTWSGYSEKGTGSQERGPGSFALQIPGVPAAQSSYHPTAVRMDQPRATPTPSTSVGIPDGRPDPTLQALLQLGQKHLQKDIDRRNEQAFIEGMVKAASGQALTEIVDSQPWYSKIFGPSGVVEGARAYTSTAAVSKWVTEQQNQMGELRKRPPGEIPGYLMGTMESFLTGDEQTDTMIRAEFVKQVPGLIKDHTKNHYIYLQETAAEARRGAFEAHANMVQGIYAGSNGDRTAEELAQAEQGLLSIFTPTPGQNLGSFYKDLSATLVNQAQAGNFHVLRVLDEAGMVSKLPQAVQTDIATALASNAPKQLAKVTRELAPEIAELNRRIALGDFEKPEDVAAALDELNDRASGITGVPRKYGELFGPDKYPAGMYRNEEARLRADVKQQEAAAAAVAGAVLTNDAGTGILDNWDKQTSAFQTGLQAYALTHVAGLKQKDIDDAVNRKLLALPAQQRASFLSAFPNDTFEAGKQILAAQWAETDRDDAQWEKVGGTWESLYQTYVGMSDTAKGRYLSKDQRDTLAAYHAARNAGRNAETAFYQRRGVLADMRNRIGEKPKGEDEAAVRAFVDDQLTSFWTRPLGGTNIPENERGIVEALLASETKRANSVRLDAEGRVAEAYGSLQRQGLLDVSSGRLILNLDGPGALKRPLTGEPGIPNAADLVFRTLNTLVDEQVERLGGDTSNRIVYRVPGDATQPIVYQIVTFDKDGKERVGMVSSLEVRDRLGKPPAKAPIQSPFPSFVPPNLKQ